MMLKAEGPLRTPAKPLHSEPLRSLLGEVNLLISGATSLCIRTVSKAVPGVVPESHQHM